MTICRIFHVAFTGGNNLVYKHIIINQMWIQHRKHTDMGWAAASRRGDPVAAHTNIRLRKAGESICDRSITLLNEDATEAKLSGQGMP